MRVVICGGGVIGACTAYFLSQRQVDAVVVERTGIAAAVGEGHHDSWRRSGVGVFDPA